MHNAVMPKLDSHKPQVEAIKYLCEKIQALDFKGFEWVHFCVELAPVDLLSFLSENSQHQQVFWKDREAKFNLAGLGHCSKIIAPVQNAFSEIKHLQRKIYSESLSDYQPLFVGGFSFNDLDGEDIWEGFPASCFVLPEICLVNTDNSYQLHIHLCAENEESWVGVKKEIQDKLHALNWPRSDVSIVEAKPHANSYNISLEEWRKCCEKALSVICSGEVDKVVLARKLTVKQQQVHQPASLLKRWLKQNPYSYAFLFQLADKAFVGCSPERLYQRQGTSLYTESLAGTVRRGKNQQSDQELAWELLSKPKLVQERALVTDFLRQQLGPYSAKLNFSNAEVMSLDRIQHGYQRIEAQLNDDVSDAELVSALHPTPAVCGFPRESAQAFIDGNENLVRGWYSGGVGVIGREYVDLAVAIRSALIEGDELHCFSGAGLVKESDADQEWQELNAKLESLLSVLYG